MASVCGAGWQADSLASEVALRRRIQAEQAESGLVVAGLGAAFTVQEALQSRRVHRLAVQQDPVQDFKLLLPGLVRLQILLPELLADLQSIPPTRDYISVYESFQPPATCGAAGRKDGTRRGAVLPGKDAPTPSSSDANGSGPPSRPWLAEGWTNAQPSR